MMDPQTSVFTPHHVGIVVADLDAAMNSYIADLGYTFFQFEVNERNACLTGSSTTFKLRFGFGRLGLNFIELIQPEAGTTLYSRHLAQHGPGLHHLGYSATDLVAARQQFATRGFTCLADGTIRGLVDFTYYEAPDLGGIIEPLQLSCDLAAFLLQNAQPYAAKSN